MQYRVPTDLTFEGYHLPRHFDGDVTIGGDKGDLFVHNAEEVEEGVVVTSAILHYFGDIALTDDEVCEISREIVDACYASVQEDTFR